jgi:hypothetical protein
VAPAHKRLGRMFGRSAKDPGAQCSASGTSRNVETSTKIAPWHLVPANNKPFGRLAAFTILIDHLGREDVHRGGLSLTTRFVAELWPHPLSGNHLVSKPGDLWILTSSDPPLWCFSFARGRATQVQRDPAAMNWAPGLPASAKWRLLGRAS